MYLLFLIYAKRNTGGINQKLMSLVISRGEKKRTKKDWKG